MTNAEPDKAIRELDRRTSDGINVRLLWNSRRGRGRGRSARHA